MSEEIATLLLAHNRHGPHTHSNAPIVGQEIVHFTEILMQEYLNNRNLVLNLGRVPTADVLHKEKGHER